MRKITLLLVMTFVSLSTLTFASQADLFSYNQDELNQEFAQLNDLEGYVLANQGVTIADVENNPVFGTMDLSGMKHSGPMAAMFSIDDMDWGAFAWGFFCCSIGFFVVAISDDASKDEKMSFWIGVIVKAVLYSVGGGTQIRHF